MFVCFIKIILMGRPFTAVTPKPRSNCWATWPWAILRRSHLGHLLRESRTIDRLDLSRAGGLFGGPYLWFNYITRMLVQETALLILDYNRHAVPVDRLACSPDAVRRKFPLLAGRPAQDRTRRGLAAGAGDTDRPDRFASSRARVDRANITERNSQRTSFEPVAPARERPAGSWRRSNSRQSISWPMTPSATPKSTPGLVRRSPSWSGATASKTSAARFVVFRSMSCR